MTVIVGYRYTNKTLGTNIVKLFGDGLVTIGSFIEGQNDGKVFTVGKSLMAFSGACRDITLYRRTLRQNKQFENMLAEAMRNEDIEDIIIDTSTMGKKAYLEANPGIKDAEDYCVQGIIGNRHGLWLFNQDGVIISAKTLYDNPSSGVRIELTSGGFGKPIVEPAIVTSFNLLFRTSVINKYSDSDLLELLDKLVYDSITVGAGYSTAFNANVTEKIMDYSEKPVIKEDKDESQ